MTQAKHTPERSAAAAFLIEARPGDALEAMLVAQMAAVHEAAMRCLSRAAETAPEHPEIEARYLREAARLLNLFQRQSDALDRRRIAAENRMNERARDERLAERDWQRESAEARRAGQRPPARPKRPCPAWPAWPAGAARAGASKGVASSREPEARQANGHRGNGAAPPS